MENSMTVSEELCKYFYETGLNFLSSAPQRRILEMILAMAQKGYSGKMADCGELGTGHRTTYGHFLSKGKWDHAKVETIQRQKSFETILSVAEKANQPVSFVIRSAKAIDRFLIILLLAWFCFSWRTRVVLPFCKM